VPRTHLRTVGRFLLGGFAALAALLPAENASALSPYLVVPTPAVAEASAAYRYANMTASEALAELDKRKVPYKLADKLAGVVAPVRLTGKLHGVTFHSAIPESQRATSIYEVLDARLALALDDFAKILERHDIEEVVHYSLYRPNVPREDHDVRLPHADTAAKPGDDAKAGSGAKPVGDAKPGTTAPARHTAPAGAKPGATSTAQVTSAGAKPGATSTSSAAPALPAVARGPGSPAGKLPAAGKPLPQLPAKSSSTPARGAKQKEPGAPDKPPSAPDKPHFQTPARNAEPSLIGQVVRSTKPSAAAKPSAKVAPVQAKSTAAPPAPAASPGHGATRTPARPTSPRAAATPQKTSTTLRGRAATPIRPEAKPAPTPSVVPTVPAAPVTRQTWAAPGTRHPAGLAIDVARLKKRDGQWLSVANHFQGKIGAKTCGEGVRNADTPEARELRSIVCEANDLGVFTYVLTPNYNAAHADHFHMEVRPQVKWFLYQ